MRRTTWAGGLALAVSTFTLIVAPLAGATTYNNDTPIIIPNSGIASPYPSSITVSGTAGPITDVNVGIDGLVHSAPSHVSIVLKAPTGQALLLIDDAGEDADGTFITLDDSGGGELPFNGPLSSGTFKPTAHSGTRSFPAPGPLTTYDKPGPVSTATFASTFNGLSPIGTWNLYVIDAVAADQGSIPGGWSLDINPDVTPPPLVTTPPTVTPTPISTPARAPAPAKKCKKKAKKGASAAKKKACRKKGKR